MRVMVAMVMVVVMEMWMWMGAGISKGGDGYGDDVMVVAVKRVRNNAYAASAGYLWFRVSSAEPSLSVLVPFVSVSNASRQCNTAKLF